MYDDKFQFPDLEDFEKVARALLPFVRRTPLLESQSVPELFFKCENLQLTGSFKIRPALSQLIQAPAAKERGIVTSSSGNFAQGVAKAAILLGINATVVMMENSSQLKMERTRELGARVAICGNRFEARSEMVAEIAQREGRVVVYPYDHGDAITGNGSIALEILQEWHDASRIVVPISGGGLIAGIALAAKITRPEIQVIGVQATGSNATALSFQQNERVSIPQARTIADGLMVTIPGEKTFQVIQRMVDAVLTVSETSIRQATRLFLARERLVVEPSGAVPMAAILEEKVPAAGSALVLSGGNISPEFMASLS